MEKRGIKTKLAEYGIIENKVQSIIESGAGVVISGDFNRPLNSQKSSYGTGLLEKWLNSGYVTLLNDRKVDTRYDPVTGKGSLLDLSIVSNNISKKIRSFEVDTDRNWTPFSVTKVGDNLIKKPSDHCAILTRIKLTSIQSNSKKKPVINFRNPDGWKNYKNISDMYAERIKIMISETRDINTLRIKLYIINKEILLESFGVSWQGSKRKKRKKRDSKQLKQLYQEQQQELNNMLEEGFSSKSLDAQIYKLKEIINGSKVSSSEPMCINDPITGELITDEESIKKVSLEHNVRILTKNSIREKDREMRKHQETYHKNIMQSADKDSWVLDRALYNEVLDRIKGKKKNMFGPIINAGEKYQDAIFEYMRRIINNEEIPFEFSATSLIPIWKKKGSALDLNMMRYIHLKSWEAKLCEALVTEKMIPNIVKACPSIQIGGIPKSSCSEHLLTLKTWMLNKESKKENGIFQVFDMENFFDKESLLDAMYTLRNKADICNKSYRLWYRLNEKARISVRTSVGESESKEIADSLGQGSFGAALI